jgi:FdhD protein
MEVSYVQLSDMKKIKKDLLNKAIAPDITCNFFSGEKWAETPVLIPREKSLTIYLNNQELVTILCTPTKLDFLVTGFMYSEGIIDSLDGITSMQIDEDKFIAHVKLIEAEYQLPSQRTRTPSGVSFRTQGQRVDSDLAVMPEEVLALMEQLHKKQRLFQKCGGIHCSVLCDHQRVLVSAEDIGRHNTLDKILGECLRKGLPTRGHILLTTGRISSEMLLKAARMQTPIIVSRGSPTERAIWLGSELGITIVGYARGSRLSVFSGEERLQSANRQD